MCPSTICCDSSSSDSACGYDVREPGGTPVAERIRAHLENVSFQSDPAEPARSVTLSMGLVSFPRDGHNETVLLSRAQTRLKEAAERGGNRVVTSDGS